MERTTTAWNNLVDLHARRVEKLKIAIDCGGSPSTAWAAAGPVAYAVDRDKTGRLIARVDTDLNTWGESFLPRSLRAMAVRPAGLRVVAESSSTEDQAHIGEWVAISCPSSIIVSCPMVITVDNDVVSVAPAITVGAHMVIKALANGETIYFEFASRTNRERGDNFGGVMVAVAAGELVEWSPVLAHARTLTAA